MKPIVIWITGLSGSGKTTVAKALYNKLIFQCKTGLLDGDDIRKYLEENKVKKYGFSLEDRKQFVNNVAYIARNMIEFQATEVVIVALISPLREMRDNARDLLERYSNVKFIEVFMDTPLEICEQRDPKGLYKKVRAGEIKDFTGIDSPYEVPEFPEFRIHPRSTLYGEMTVDRVVNMLYNRVQEIRKPIYENNNKNITTK
jgi:adenylyl-sulfate kinase